MEVMVKSIPVYYEEYGTGMPILMLHGYMADHRSLVAGLEPLFRDRPGWRRIYPDLPGMGKTPGAEWMTNHDHFLEVVSGFMHIVASGQRFVVGGYSYGGYLARGLVYQQGAMIDGVLLMVPGMEADPAKRHLPPPQVLVEDAQFQAAITPAESFLLERTVVQSLETLEYFRAYIQPVAAGMDQNFFKMFAGSEGFSFPVDHPANPFPGPALILTGRQDSTAGYREAWTILENYPRGSFAVLDRAGHRILIDQPELFKSLINEWLDRVEEYIAQNAT
jgi:pimeloyl-ACP methyl ester carboxylesterase